MFLKYNLKFFLKRIFDLIVIIFSLPFLMILILIIFFIILLVDRHYPFFIQHRSGYNKITFKFIKFRTMKNLNDNNNIILSDQNRVTPLGIILRKTSLDELPSIYNVLKGDMSIVGPRPLLFEYNNLYNSEQLLRFNVKPGITGLAQINGRNAISWSDKFKYDVDYVKNRTFLMDIIIIIKTIKLVITNKNINQKNMVGSEKFKGNKNE
jgi:undecaprenyl phosphate N,N'-diacetylbacillosamine 1-phosphate transferase